MDEQNQNGMNEGAANAGTSMDEQNHVHAEGGSKKPGMLATVAIVVLVALLGYGVYAYLNKGEAPMEEGMIMDEEGAADTMDEGEAEEDMVEVDLEESATTEVEAQ